MNFVVTLQQNESGQLLAHLSRSPLNLPGADVVRPIPLDATALPPFDTRPNAECYGRAIQQALGSHPAIRQALTRLYEAPIHSPGTLMFEIRVPAAEALRWEALCDNDQGFAAVNLGAKVGRVAARATSLRSPPRALSWPLRLAAFLSPAGISAEAEKDELIGAVKSARAAGLDCRLHLYLGEPRLIDDVQRRIEGGELEGVEVRPIPAEPAAFEAAIRDTNPHVLHFFCHGFSHSGLQHLEFATVSDWRAGNPSGSSLLAISRLSNIPGLRRCWLTVLNCCRGASAVDQAHSMAYSVVVDGGCPAAVGMNEPIEAVDATAFARVFYDALLNGCFADLKAMRAGDHLDVDLTPAVRAARMQLYDTYSLAPPDAFGRWSLPVLYVSSDPLRITHTGRAGDAAGNLTIEQKSEMIAKLLRELAEGTPTAFRQQLYSLLDQEPVVPAGLRPDQYGNFPR